MTDFWVTVAFLGIAFLGTFLLFRFMGHVRAEVARRRRLWRAEADRARGG